MQLSLTPEEVALLKDVLTNYLSDLRAEVSNTDNFDLREQLKRDEASLKTIIERLQSSREAQS